MSGDIIRATGATPTLGIGILTYNRVDKLKRAVDEVRRRTSSPFCLVVADDGSSDETAQWLEADGVTRIRGRNMGVCWNKNRLLYFMTNVLACDVVLLLEDDCYPEEDGWERPWIEAVRLHGHINLAGGWFDQFFQGGAGTPEDPVRCKLISGQCVGYSRKAIQQVGYFDTRFRGYGIGHVEHSWRMARAGHGGYMDPRDDENPIYLLLGSRIRVDGEHAHSGRDENALARNQSLFAQIRRDGVHRWAWRTDDEMRQFVEEMEDGSTTLSANFGQMPKTADAEIGPPHLFDGEEKLLAESIARYGHRYMEFGVGGSTLLAAKAAGGAIVAVDSNIRWINKVRAEPAVAAAIRAGRASLLHADIGPLGEWGFPADESRLASWPDYIRLPWTEWEMRRERPGLIFVDGRFRLACCLSVVVALGPWRAVGEIPHVLLHDFNAARPFYQPVLDFFEVEAVEGTLHLLRMRRDASPIAALATMLGSLSDPR
jgi:glycosyltransferase involved in cell wall biosynthesis